MTESTAGAQIDRLLDLRASADLVAVCCDPDSDFAGLMFDELGDNPPHAITRDDLLAVSLLDVRFKPRALRTLLGSEVLPRLLHLVPTDVVMWDADDTLLFGPLQEIWDALVDVDGVGEVKAGKLLARKRPHLVPIVDRVVRDVLGPGTKNYWRAIRTAMSSPERRDRVEALRPRGGEGLSLLRLLDILIWMHGSNAKSAHAARARVGLSAEPFVAVRAG